MRYDQSLSQLAPAFFPRERSDSGEFGSDSVPNGSERQRAGASRSAKMSSERDRWGSNRAHFCRDHTTVLHAMRRIRGLMAEDAGLKAQVEGCRELIARAGPWRAHAAAQRDGARSAP